MSKIAEYFPEFADGADADQQNHKKADKFHAEGKVYFRIQKYLDSNNV